jgi:hypothetical protein
MAFGPGARRRSPLPWIPALRLRGDKLRGNDEREVIFNREPRDLRPTHRHENRDLRGPDGGFPLPAFAGTSFAGMTSVR